MATPAPSRQRRRPATQKKTQKKESPPAAARAADATKVYGSGATAVRALDGVAVEFLTGRYTAIMGPSGSGKSTLLNVIGLLDTPSGGRVAINGREVRSFSDRSSSARPRSGARP